MHLWRVHVDLSDDEGARRALEVLSADERDRAARFRLPEDRVRFVAARARFREMVAGYLDMAPAAVVFEMGPHGKPAVVGAPWLGVSVARSGGVALMGAARDAEIGVDVERVDREFPWEEVAGTVFDAREREALAGLPDTDRADAAFELWVRKEALAKMAGVGIAHVLDGDHPLPDPRGCFLAVIEPAGGYRGALAARPAGRAWGRRGPAVRLWDIAGGAEPR